MFFGKGSLLLLDKKGDGLVTIDTFDFNVPVLLSADNEFYSFVLPD